MRQGRFEVNRLKSRNPESFKYLFWEIVAVEIESEVVRPQLQSNFIGVLCDDVNESFVVGAHSVLC